ncbi:MAG TPA: HD domain-containing protein, partial [Clostridiales bacterium]|nr:HD domain-containing protein [Clostridiales bacterium]
AFQAVVNNRPDLFSKEQKEWYEQILRLMALTHDLGHAPFSHGSEAVFPNNLSHEDFTEEIIMKTEIGDFIHEIGQEFVEKYDEEYNITPELICSIYRGRNISNPDFIFLKKFLDSELDCDKMDYLLRDSYYCGVNYGRYDLERLVSMLTVYKEDNNNLYLAIKKGGLCAFEEFVLARYFMFIQVYFHRTRRFLDKMLVEFLRQNLSDGKYPDEVGEYLTWNDNTVWRLIRDAQDKDEYANRLMNRRIMKCVYESPTHSEHIDQNIFNYIKNVLGEKIGKDNFIYDSADKLAHKIPLKHTIDSEQDIPEQAIPIILDHTKTPGTISTESGVIKNMTEPINIWRIYAKEEMAVRAKNLVNDIFNKMSS